MLVYGYWLTGDIEFLRQDLGARQHAILATRRGAPELVVQRGTASPAESLQHYLRGSQASPSPIHLRSDAKPGSNLPGQRWQLEIEDHLRAEWCSGQSRLQLQPYHALADSDLRYFLLQSVLPAYAEIERSLRVLHAGAVVTQGRAMLFLGDSGAGKSTLAHACVQAGADYLADDRAVIRFDAGAARSLGAYPWCRPYRKALSLGDFVGRFAAESTPLSAAWVLRAVPPDAPVATRRLDGGAAFSAFHASRGLRIPFLDAEHFAHSATLAGQIPLRQIDVPRSLARLPEVVDRVFAGH